MPNECSPSLALELSPRRSVTAFGQLTLALLGGALLAAVFSTDNLVTWVEEWPPSPVTDSAIGAVHALHGWSEQLGLASVHPGLRRAERALE